MSQIVGAVLIFFLFWIQADWTQWRGSQRDGSVPIDSSRTNWPEQLPMLWEVEIGEGYSGPIVKSNLIWIHSRQNEDEIVSCLRLDNGNLKWSQRQKVPFVQDSTARDHGLGPYSTPALDKGRLFTLSVTNLLTVWEARSGKVLWRKDYSSEFDHAVPYFGASFSPLIWENLCFIHFGGHDRESQMLTGSGAMIALEVNEGREIWRWSGDAPALAASPMIFKIGNQLQLVFKTREKIVGLEAQTGNELWQIPFDVPMDNTIVTPTVIDNILVTSDYRMGVFAWRIQSEGDSWILKHIWRNHRVSMFISSPIFMAGLLVGFSEYRSGQIFGLDPRSGQIMWRGEPRWGEHATLVSYGDHLLVFREDGFLIVGEVSRNHFKIIRNYELGQSTMWGHPAVTENRLILKNGKRLAVYALGS